ncbi:hypothetical protein RFI_13513 [Reticulomyxa filosa]|uniref:Uncharacterized protein n=1 Tax=Reticulomyxa filosa TaxID=46433 RepID=X6NCP5_RETFI|nr:hypothetical protein RFI_13513 [Reticulomyxa filosa]|eukprot:ETO23668.1 hypothetical protein RFI_13513 [Reticulomyxa filosa]
MVRTETKQEYKPPQLFSWGAFALVGLIATSATGMLVVRGWGFNRNLDAMQKFWTRNSPKIRRIVEETPLATHEKDNQKIFRSTVSGIVNTAAKISQEKIDLNNEYMKGTYSPEGDEHVNPPPISSHKDATFAPEKKYKGTSTKRTLLSSKPQKPSQ